MLKVNKRFSRKKSSIFIIFQLTANYHKHQFVVHSFIKGLESVASAATSNDQSQSNFEADMEKCEQLANCIETEEEVPSQESMEN